MKKSIILSVAMLLALLSCQEVNGKDGSIYKSPPATPIYTYFKEINAISRPSQEEGKMTKYICDFAIKHGLEYRSDSYGNVIIKKPATNGFENKPTLVLQSHLDMVYVVDDGISFNHLTDPIPAYTENGWIKSRGTSLGADDGIGISMTLAILADKTISHPSLEALFTTDEEDGMSGGRNMDKNFITGRRIINLDSEDYYNIVISSASGIRQDATFSFVLENAPSNTAFFNLDISGGEGGHSGIYINKNRANTIKLIASFIRDYSSKHTLYLASINGGNAMNSIPNKINATISVPLTDVETIKSNFREYATIQSARFKESDPNLKFDIKAITTTQTKVIPQGIMNNMLNALTAYPDGVLEMLNNNLETSNNIGTIETQNDRIVIGFFSRSQMLAKVKKVGAQIKEITTTHNGVYNEIQVSAGWDANYDSSLLKEMQSAYQKIVAFTPPPLTVHAGLECGLFAEKYPDADIISISPEIINSHSPKESVDCATIDKLWEILIHFLRQ